VTESNALDAQTDTGHRNADRLVQVGVLWVRISPAIHRPSVTEDFDGGMFS
jgi:hypothetical protein